MNLYIVSQGAMVTKQDRHVVVRKDGEVLEDRLVDDLRTVVTFGAVQISTQALLFMLENGVDISMMTHDGHFRGQVRSSLGKNITLRHAQYKYCSDPSFCLDAAREIISAKIANCAGLLYRYQRNRNNPADVAEECAVLKDQCAQAAAAENIDSLRGMEGHSAKVYFAGIAKCFKEGVNFSGRAFYPSPDPINALLSFGYSFLMRELQSVLEANCIDPYLGFFHQIKYGRASLACDLVEPFRPAVDRLVLKVFNLGILDQDDFYTQKDGGCYLKRESLSVFIKYYEEYWRGSTQEGAFAIGDDDDETDKETALRPLVRSQVELLAAAFAERAAFKAVLIP